MAIAAAPQTEYTVIQPCAACDGDLPFDAPKQRRLCDRCRELARVRTFLNQARLIAERLGYDSPLEASR